MSPAPDELSIFYLGLKSEVSCKQLIPVGEVEYEFAVFEAAVDVLIPQPTAHLGTLYIEVEDQRSDFT